MLHARAILLSFTFTAQGLTVYSGSSAALSLVYKKSWLHGNGTPALADVSSSIAHQLGRISEYLQMIEIRTCNALREYLFTCTPYVKFSAPASNLRHGAVLPVERAAASQIVTHSRNRPETHEEVNPFSSLQY